MKKLINQKVIALILTISLLVTGLCIPSRASDIPISDGGISEEIKTEDEKLTTDLSGIRHLSSESLASFDFLGRYEGKEDLNSYVFLNRDGTESVIIFPENIKYVNENGKISEKDTTLIPDEKGGYTVKANDYYVNLPQNIKDGYTFSAEKHEIKIMPVGIDAEAKIEENSVLYEGYSNTTFKYTLTLSGVKEDIILNEYTGKNTFDFTLFSKDLVPKENDGIISLFDEKDNPIIDFEKIYAYDAKGNIVLGDISLSSVNEENTYKISVSVDEEFLANPATEYPVIIDPSIEESSDGTAIQDATIYDSDGYRNSNFGSSKYNIEGHTTSPDGEARTAMKLNGLSANSIYKTLDAEEIVSCKIIVDDATGAEARKHINLYRISSNVTWTENTVTWNNVGTVNTSIDAGTTLRSGDYFEFDITDFVKGWKNGSYTNSMSVLFQNDSLTNSDRREFYSSDSNEGNKPYIVFTYQYKNLMNEGSYYIMNKELQKFVQPVGGLSGTSAGTGMELRDFSGSNAQIWTVSSLGGGYYQIKNKNSNLVLAVHRDSYSSENTQLIQDSSSSSENGQKWRIYITSYSGFALKPKSANNGTDGENWTNLVMSVNDGNNGNGAIVSQRSYAYNNSFKDEWYLVPANITNGGTYCLKNRQLNTNARPVNGTIQSNQGIELWTAGTGNEQKWVFTRQTDGYYKISPKNNSSYALTIASGSETAENGTVRLESYSSTNTRQQWLIYKVPSGYCFKAKSSGTANLVLSVSEGNLGNGAVVSQRAFVNNLSYKEEWFIAQNDNIPEGIYYIKQGTLYLTVNNSAILNNTNVNVSSLASSSANMSQKAAQMWKIKDAGNGNYSIRPLHNLNMGLNTNNQNADIYSIGVSDLYTEVSEFALFSITDRPNGYLIRNRNAEAKTLSAAATTSGSNAGFVPSTGSSLQYWELVEVTSSNIPKGIAFYDESTGLPLSSVSNKYIAPEQVASLSDLNLVACVINPTVVGQNAMLSVPSSNQSYLKVDSSNRLVGVKYKSTAIQVTAKANISGTNYSKTFSVYVPRVANGEYFLENRQKEQYAHIDGSLTANQDVIRHNFTGDNNERWEIKLNNQTGYYTIKSLASGSTPYYLQVLNNSTTLDQIVVVNTYSGTLPTGMQWKFELTANGSYKILPKSGESSGYVLSTGSIQTDLRQGAYVDNASYLDEWYIMKVDTAVLLAKEDDYDNLNKAAYFPDTISRLQTKRNSKITAVDARDFSEIDEDLVLSLIRNNNIVIECSHGSASSFRINGNSNDAPFDGDCIYASQLSYRDLSNVDFIMFMSCDSGANYSPTETYPNSLVRGAELGGAGCIIGFDYHVDINDAHMFLKYLLKACVENNKTVQQAKTDFYIDANTMKDGYGNKYIDAGFRQHLICKGNLNYSF